MGHLRPAVFAPMDSWSFFFFVLFVGVFLAFLFRFVFRFLSEFGLVSIALALAGIMWRILFPPPLVGCGQA